MNDFLYFFICFFSFMSLKIDAAAATMLQLQKYYYSKSIHNKKLNLYTKFSDNQYIAFCIIQFAAFSSFISERLAAAAAAAAILQLQQRKPSESIQNIKLPYSNKFSNKISSKTIIFRGGQFGPPPGTF